MTIAAFRWIAFAARFAPLDWPARRATMARVANASSTTRRVRAADARRRVLRKLYPKAPERPRFLETRLLRAGEVAALLQVSRRSVAAWAQRGMIPFIETPGGHRRFRAADVRALVASLRRVAVDETLLRRE